jgi:tripartite-type tricarboxylate transporter receptor subunit TctC
MRRRILAPWRAPCLSIPTLSSRHPRKPILSGEIWQRSMLMNRDGADDLADDGDERPMGSGYRQFRRCRHGADGMILRRRQLLRLAAGAAALSTLSHIAKAQSYPTRPIRMVVGFAAGSAPDIAARLMAQWLSERLGQQIIVDNRPGAASNVATETVVRAPPDGYLLLLVTTANVVNSAVYNNLGYDFLRDVAPVAGIDQSPNVMVVNPSFPAMTVPEFIRYAKANPGKINMASGGNGSASHVAGELFKMMAGVDMLHVPYRGNYQPDLLAGLVQVAFSPLQGSIEHIRAGKLRALAVTTATRSDALPDVPAVVEFVAGYEATVWTGVGVPKNTSPGIIDKLNKQINVALADPKARARLADLGARPMSMTPSEFGQFVKAETEKWGKVVKFAGIPPL